MGQISGVDAALITSIAGVAVANISYVGPTSAAAIGLGGGGGGGTPKALTLGFYGTSEEACINGPADISRGRSQTVYYKESNNTVYADEALTIPFNGDDSWWYNGTDGQSWVIAGNGRMAISVACG
jgi:hypothetical protein